MAKTSAAIGQDDILQLMILSAKLWPPPPLGIESYISPVSISEAMHEAKFFSDADTLIADHAIAA